MKIGDGSKASWEDLWCGEAPLCSSFPFLYGIASFKGVRVEDLKGSGPLGVLRVRGRMKL